eukprot:835671-Alexandrium_andersonii.AAC.1
MALGDADDPRVAPGARHGKGVFIDRSPERRQGVPEGRRQLEEGIGRPAIYPRRSAAASSG